MLSILLGRYAKSVERYEWVFCEGNKWRTCASVEIWPLSGCVDIGMLGRKQREGVWILAEKEGQIILSKIANECYKD